MKTLQEIYTNYQGPDGWGDKGTAHTYIDEYAKLFEPYRHNSTVLEIGLAYGHSLKMWNEYFINSKVIGVDITTNQIGHLMNNANYNIIISDATKPDFLKNIEGLIFDVIIDDGSHTVEDQVNSFKLLKNLVKAGGIYVIEDVQNIDHSKNIFENLHSNMQVIDNRHLKNRYDDVLVVFKF